MLKANRCALADSLRRSRRDDLFVLLMLVWDKSIATLLAEASKVASVQGKTPSSGHAAVIIFGRRRLMADNYPLLYSCFFVSADDY